MATNDFKPFATAANANVTAQADWEALPALLSGFTAGKASSAQVNKAIRQATTIGALMGQFIANSGVDALDNGDIAGLVTKFTNALNTNLQLGTAAKRDVGTGANNIPDMLSFASLQSASGYQQLPGGLILQWVNTTAPDNSTSGSVALPVSFPTQTLVAYICDAITTGSPNSFNLAWSINTTTKNSIAWVSTSTGVGAFTIFAIGK